MADIDRDLIFSRLPPDSGVVTPIAPLDEEPDETIVAQLDKMRLALPSWKPGKVDDPVQRVRNYPVRGRGAGCLSDAGARAIHPARRL